MRSNLIFTKFALIGVITIAAVGAKAQRGVPANLAPSYNKMMSNMSMQNNMMMQHMMYNPSFRLGYMVNPKFEFRVLMKDSSMRIFRSKILPDTATHSNYLLMVNSDLPKSDPKREQKIYPKETLKISRLDNDGTEYVGMPNDSCWLFKIISGKITAYSIVSQTYQDDSIYLTAFSVDNGPIQKLTPDALGDILKPDERAYRAFKADDYFMAINRFNKDSKAGK